MTIPKHWFIFVTERVGAQMAYLRRNPQASPNGRSGYLVLLPQRQCDVRFSHCAGQMDTPHEPKGFSSVTPLLHSRETCVLQPGPATSNDYTTSWMQCEDYNTNSMQRDVHENKCAWMRHLSKGTSRRGSKELDRRSSWDNPHWSKGNRTHSLP